MSRDVVTEKGVFIAIMRWKFDRMVGHSCVTRRSLDEPVRGKTLEETPGRDRSQAELKV